MSISPSKCKCGLAERLKGERHDVCLDNHIPLGSKILRLAFGNCDFKLKIGPKYKVRNTVPTFFKLTVLVLTDLGAPEPNCFRVVDMLCNVRG